MTTRSIYPEAAYGVRPIKALLGPDLLCIFESEEQIRNMNPNQMKLSKLTRLQSVVDMYIAD